jgi:hypothetical protein
MMTKARKIVAMLSTVAARAFANPGWKMDGDKLALDANGNPIYVNSDGQEQSVKADTISTLNAEAKNHRVAKEGAEATLAKYKGADGKLIDPEAAIKAIDTVSKIDAKKLIDAGEVDKVRDAIKNEFTTQLGEKDAKIAELSGVNKTMTVDRAFDASEFIRDRVNVPRDMFRDSFGKNVKVGDDGKLEFYGRDGNRLLSKKNAGEYAGGDEAFELMVDQHPQKDTILKAQSGSGSGNGGGGGSRPGSRTVRRSDFDAMNPSDKAQAGAAMQKGELSIVD